MANRSVKRFFENIAYRKSLVKGQESCRQFVYSVLNRFQSQWSKLDKIENHVLTETQHASQEPAKPKVVTKSSHDSGLSKYSSDDNDLSDNKWKLELAWITRALEPALQLCRWALPKGNEVGSNPPPSTLSLSEILASIQRSKVGIQDWSLSDLTVGLYLVYLRQASANPLEDVKGVQISSDSIVQDLIYHTELAKGAYKNNATGIARNSMLRESNIVKFVRNSSVMRPGYYIGIDARKKLVVLGIRGTHTVYDLITDIVTSSDGEVTFEGYSTHFGTTEAARWFLSHEMGTIKKCLEKHEVVNLYRCSISGFLRLFFSVKFLITVVVSLIHLQGFRLRLVGHSLGGAIASLLAIMLRKMSSKELGFCPDVVSAVGYATPPCVSRELAENCSEYVTTVVMQDDIIPRLNVASLIRLRNEIIQTDWMSILEKEDWKNVIGLVTNAKQLVSSVQDVAQKLADYANFRSKTDIPISEEPFVAATAPSASKRAGVSAVISTSGRDACTVPEELFVPGTLYYLKRDLSQSGGSRGNSGGSSEFFTLWKRHPGEHFHRIVLSSNLFSDHKCDNHYYALRDVLKGLPRPIEEVIF